MATVKLTRPIKRGETEINSIDLVEPNAGSLRGTRLTDLLNGDVDAVVTVLPRISAPAIQKHEINLMSARDLALVTEEIIGFFMEEQKFANQEPSLDIPPPPPPASLEEQH